jgi:putative RecB family exonuclease
MKPLSYSQISQYLQCPLCYRLQYIDGLKPEEKWYFSFGTTLHLCAEYFFRISVPPPPSLQQLLKFYDDNWLSAGYASPEDENNHRVYGRELLTDFWKIHSNGFRMPVAVEQWFSIDIEGVKLRGLIDRVDRLGDGLSIVDYKSSRELFTADHLEQDLQLTLYQLAAQQMWRRPVKQLTLYHLRTNTACTCSAREEHRLEEARRLVLQTAGGIEKGDFPAIENQFCPCDFAQYCPYHRHEHMSATEELQPANRLKGASAADLVENYASLQKQIKALEIQLEELRQMIIGYCRDEELNRLYGNEHAVTFKIYNKTEYDEEAVRALLEPAGLWEKVLQFDPAQIKALLADVSIRRDIKTKLECLRRIMPGSPRLFVRKLKEE